MARPITIAGMFFGGFPDELSEGAHNAVGICLRIDPAERVALIADEASREVAAAIEQALDDDRAETTPLLIEDVTPRPMRQAPVEILDAL